MVDCGIPSRLAAALPPVDCANLTASALNSSVYRRFGTDSFFPISPSVHQKFTKILMYVKPGQGHITEGVDRDQLAPMAEQARAATGGDDLTVVADRGYFKGEQILDCDQAGITPIVPKTLTSNSLADGRFDKQDFIYIASDDEYRCPAGQRAINRFTTMEAGMMLDVYWSQRARIARSKRAAPPAHTDGSGAGSTRLFSKRCSSDWIGNRR